MTFQSTLPARGATNVSPCSFCARNFNPRSPHGERPDAVSASKTSILISIHAPRTGSDFCLAIKKENKKNFNPRSPHGERRLVNLQAPDSRAISIHAPRTGSDRQAASMNVSVQISIHAPRTGSDLQLFAEFFFKFVFQSTLPARGATVGMAILPPKLTRISIHAPRTGSDRRRNESVCRTRNFNPRSPHGERRLASCYRRRQRQFQSTLPARGATRQSTEKTT